MIAHLHHFAAAVPHCHLSVVIPEVSYGTEFKLSITPLSQLQWRLQIVSSPTRVDDDPSRAVIYNPVFQRRSQDGSGRGRDGGRGNDSSTDGRFEYEEPSLAAAPVPIMRSVNSTPNTSQGTKSTATCWITTVVLVALTLSIVAVVLGSMSISGRGSMSAQQASASMGAPAYDASAVVDMRELVANMTLLRELVQAQADTIVFLEARVRVLEETSAPTLVPSLTPTSVPTSAPT